MESNKIFKGLLFATAALFTLNVNAFTHVASGLYFGLGAQYASGAVDYNSNTTFNLGLIGREAENANLSATGYSGIALIGFGFPLDNHFYLGAEAQGVLSNQQGKLNVNSFFQDGPQILQFKARIKYLNNYGIFIRPGYYLGPDYLLFLRGGYINGGFQVAAVPSELGSVVPSLDDVAQKKRASGFLVGGGIEIHLIKGWGGRAEYDFMDYAAIKTNTITTFLVPGTTSERVTAFTANKFSPEAGVFTLALIYSFGYHNSD